MPGMRRRRRSRKVAEREGHQHLPNQREGEGAGAAPTAPGAAGGVMSPWHHPPGAGAKGEEGMEEKGRSKTCLA